MGWTCEACAGCFCCVVSCCSWLFVFVRYSQQAPISGRQESAPRACCLRYWLPCMGAIQLGLSAGTGLCVLPELPAAVYARATRRRRHRCSHPRAAAGALSGELGFSTGVSAFFATTTDYRPWPRCLGPAPRSESPRALSTDESRLGEVSKSTPFMSRPTLLHLFCRLGGGPGRVSAPHINVGRPGRALQPPASRCELEEHRCCRGTHF